MRRTNRLNSGNNGGVRDVRLPGLQYRCRLDTDSDNDLYIQEPLASSILRRTPTTENEKFDRDI